LLWEQDHFSDCSTIQKSGFSFYVKDDRLVFDSNALAKHYVVRSDKPVPSGKSTLGAAFTWADDKGTITLLILCFLLEAITPLSENQWFHGNEQNAGRVDIILSSRPA
jgi:hypothetical protein